MRHNSPNLARFYWLVLLAASVSVCCRRAEADAIVVPTSLRDSYGNTSAQLTDFPFQQVFLQDAFSSAKSDEILITGLALRWDEDTPAANLVVPSITIALSTFSGSPQELNSNPIRNRGADEIRTFQSFDVPISSQVPNSPDDFALAFRFQRSFMYRRSAGQLVLDMGLIGAAQHGGREVGLDYHRFTPGENSDVRWITGTQGGVLPEGLVVEFTFLQVPEPAPFLVIALGTVILCARPFLERRRNRV